MKGVGSFLEKIAFGFGFSGGGGGDVVGGTNNVGRGIRGLIEQEKLLKSLSKINGVVLVGDGGKGLRERAIIDKAARN